MIIREVSGGEKKVFNNLVGHITQSFEWGDFRLRTKGVAKVSRLGVFDGQKMTRAYQIFFHKAPVTSHIIAYMPRVPLPSAEEWETIKKICRDNGAIYLKIEPIEKPADSLGVVCSDDILPRHNIILNISRPEEEILLGMHEKTRYNIKIAQKNGVTVLEKEDPGSLEQFIKLYDATQKRQGFYAKSGDYIRTLWETLKETGMVRLLCAYVPGENSPVVAAMFFFFKDTFYFPYAGWSAEYREKMPNNLLHFEAIKLGKKLGAKHYDFWSSYKNFPNPTDPWYGTYVFKKGFGGEEVHYLGAYDFVFNKPIYIVMKIADGVRWKMLRLKRRLLF